MTESEFSVIIRDFQNFVINTNAEKNFLRSISYKSTAGMQHHGHIQFKKEKGKKNTMKYYSDSVW